MQELQESVAKAKKIYEYYRGKINEKVPQTAFMSVPRVIVHPNDYNQLNLLLHTLGQQINQFSIDLSKKLVEISSKLYICDGLYGYLS